MAEKKGIAEKKVMSIKKGMNDKKMGTNDKKMRSSVTSRIVKPKTTFGTSKACAESKEVVELKKLFAETISIDAALQQEIHKVEKTFEPQYHELYVNRMELLEAFKKENIEEDFRLKSFWLNVLKLSFAQYIAKEDEKVLKHLIDIRSTLNNEESSVRFNVAFHFESNPYFSNDVLYKTYYVKSSPDVDHQLKYEGAEVYKSEGCSIEWKDNPIAKAAQKKTIFFDFFHPPELPKDCNHPKYDDIKSVLENDYLLGTYLTERVIPKAVLFFTGEISDCLVSDSSSSGGEEGSSSTVTTEEDVNSSSSN